MGTVFLKAKKINFFQPFFTTKSAGQGAGRVSVMIKL